MKRLKGFVIGVMALGVFPSVVRAQPLRLTLEQALDIALSENLSVQIADREVEKAGYAKKGTYASLFPQVDFSADYQRTIKKQMMYMDGFGDSGEDGGDAGAFAKGISVGRDNNWSTGFTASMPLISPTLWKSLKISALDVELAVEEARSSRIDMVENVTKAFYTVLLAKDTYDVFVETYENARVNHENIKKKYELGLSTEYDLLRSSVSVKNAEPNMYDAENTIILAQWQLKALIGIDLEYEIECVGQLSDYNANMSVFPSGGVSLDENSDLRQIDLQGQLLQKTYEMKKAEYYPKLNLGFSYQWNAMTNDFRFNHFNWNPYSVVGATLSIPIFSGGKRLNDTRQVKSSLHQIDLQRQEIERNLSVAMIQYLNNMQTNIKQFEAAASGVEEAQKGYEISVKMYETGNGNLVEINDAQLALTQARLNLNQSVYDYLYNKTSLERITGQYEEQPY